MPARDSSLGFLLYYANVIALIAASALASLTETTLVFVAAGACLAALIAQDVAWLRASYLPPRDRALIEKISTLMRETRTNDLLRHRDFCKHGVSDSDLDNLKTIHREWIGVDFEFQSNPCRTIWLDTLQHIESLLEILSQHADYHNAYNFIVPDKAAGGRANDEAHQILEGFEALRRIYIQKMPYA